MTHPISQIPQFYELVPVNDIAAEESAVTERPSDTNAETLPFTQLGGPRFEVLSYHLLCGDPLNPEAKVVLVKASGDQRRDVLVYTDGILRTIVQCKNQASAVTKPQLLRELVKLVLHNLMTPFLASGGAAYEMWAPGGLTEPAEKLLAEWPHALPGEEIRQAFDSVTGEYEKLKGFQWDICGEALMAALGANIRPWRQLNVDLARRVRNNPDLHVRYFVATSVMPTQAVQAFFRQKEAEDQDTKTTLLSAVTQTNESFGVIRESLSKLQVQSDNGEIDLDIDYARDRVRAGFIDEGKTLLKRVQERHVSKLTAYHRFRLASNLAFAALQESKLAEASQLFLQALQYEPENELARVNEVLAYYLIREHATAFAKASSLREIYLASGRLASFWIMTAPEDTKTSELADQVGPIFRADADVALAVAQRGVQHDELELAGEYALILKKIRPDTSQPFSILAQIELRRTIRALNSRPSNKKDMIARAEETAKLASEALTFAVREGAKPTQVEILLVRCRALLAQGKSSEGSNDAATAFALLPEHPDALLALAESHLATGNFQESADAAEKLNEVSPALPVRVMQTHALIATGSEANLDKGIAILREITGQLPQPMMAPAAIMAVKAMLRRNATDVAHAFLHGLTGKLDVVTELALQSAIEPDANRAVEIALDSKSRCTDEVSTETKDFLARTFMRLQRPGDALSLFQELYELDLPGFELRLLVDCAFKLERHDLIMEVFDKLSEQPGRTWDEVEFEVQFLEKYNIPKAITRLIAFLEDNPNHKLAQLRLSTIGVLHRKPELVKSSIVDLPTVEELPDRYIRVAVGVLSQGPDKAKAVDYAYRYLRNHFDELDAHQAMMQSVLATGSVAIPQIALPVVEMGAAVQYQMLPNGELKWVVLEETDRPVRDFDEISQSDPRTAELLGKKVGETFIVVKQNIRDIDGVIKQIMPKYLRRHHATLASISELFPGSHVVESIIIEPADHPLQLGLAAVLASAQSRSLRVEEIRKVYQTMPMSLHLYGAHVGKNAYAALINIASTDKLAVKCAVGTSDEYQRASTSLANATLIVLDLSAIATLRLLGLTHALSSSVYSFGMSESTWLELTETLGPGVTEVLDGGILAFEDGEYRMYQESADEKTRRLARDAEFIRELESTVQRLPPTQLAAWPPEDRKTVIDFVGLYGAEAIALSTQQNAVLWTDDVIQSHLGAGMFGLSGAWTQCVLARLADSGGISRQEYVEATAKLVGFEYAGTYLDSEVLIECARQSQYDPEAAPLKQAIEVIASPQANPQVRFGMFRQLLAHLYSGDVSPMRGCMVIRSCLVALAQTPVLWQQLMILRRNSRVLFGLDVIAGQNFNRCFDAWKRGY